MSNPGFGISKFIRNAIICSSTILITDFTKLPHQCIQACSPRTLPPQGMASTRGWLPNMAQAQVKLQRVQELELEMKFVQIPQAATQESASSPQPTLSLISRCSVSDQPTPPSFQKKNLPTGPNSTLRTHNLRARLLCRNSKEIDLSEDTQEPRQGWMQGNQFLNTQVIIQIATDMQVVYGMDAGDLFQLQW